jgi:hypothetical protein
MPFDERSDRERDQQRLGNHAEATLGARRRRRALGPISSRLAARGLRCVHYTTLTERVNVCVG